MLKLFIPLIMLWLLNPLNNTTYVYSKNLSYTISSSIYLKNIFVYNNNEIEFFIPSNLKLKYLHPFSFVSPTGKQLIHIIPQTININNSRVNIKFNRPLEEYGLYQVTFSGVDEFTNTQIDLRGQFTYN